jgi:glucokinase
VLGEKEFGLGKGLSNLVYITLSTGIGGGAIVDGKLLIGKDGNAVEIGHMVIDKEGKLLCGCGKPGHWEAYCSGANIPRFVRLWFKSHEVEKSKLFELGGTNLSKLTSKLLFEAAKLGDEVAIQVVEEIGRLNAMGFANLINAYDPELITVGGAVALNNPELVLRPIKKYVKDFAVNRVPKIALTPLGEDVTLYGLLAVVLRSD